MIPLSSLLIKSRALFFENFTLRLFVSAALLINAPTLASFPEEASREAGQPPAQLRSSDDPVRLVERNFLRDVMQPVGIPFVSFFHHMRENIFLNTAARGGSLMERIGNFCLLPHRYLFAGKTIKLEEPDIEIVQSFDYLEGHWFKVIGSLLVLPVTEPIGAALKGLSYLSPVTRERALALRNALSSSATTPPKGYPMIEGISSFHSSEYIPCQRRPRPSRRTQKQKRELNALQEIISLFEADGVLYWIDFGTCLGAYRYGGIIPWDWDIDIAILAQDHNRVKQLLSTLDREQYQVQDWSSYTKPKTLLKLYIKETKNFIDIYHYEINEEKKSIHYLFTYEESPFPESWKSAEMPAVRSPLTYDQLFPLRRADFDGILVWAPQDIIAFLHGRYGQNLEPNMAWNEELQRYIKIKDHPYWAQDLGLHDIR